MRYKISIQDGHHVILFAFIRIICFCSEQHNIYLSFVINGIINHIKLKVKVILSCNNILIEFFLNLILLQFEFLFYFISLLIINLISCQLTTLFRDTSRIMLFSTLFYVLSNIFVTFFFTDVKFICVIDVLNNLVKCLGNLSCNCHTYLSFLFQ